MAWLNATPKPPEGSKRSSTEKEEARLTRLADMRRRGVKPAMPPTSAPHLLGWFIEIGMIEPGAAGPVPLSWREIEAWQVSSGVSLEPWEARLMRRLSTEYLNEGQKAEPENCPPPWRAPITQADRDAEEADLRGLMG